MENECKQIVNCENLGFNATYYINREGGYICSACIAEIAGNVLVNVVANKLVYVCILGRNVFKYRQSR